MDRKFETGFEITIFYHFYHVEKVFCAFFLIGNYKFIRNSNIIFRFLISLWTDGTTVNDGYILLAALTYVWFFVSESIFAIIIIEYVNVIYPCMKQHSD